MKIKPEVKNEIKDFAREELAAEKEVTEIVSAQKLSEEDFSALKQKVPDFMKGKVVKSIDPSLLAGVVLRRGSQMVDFSLRSRLASYEKLMRDL